VLVNVDAMETFGYTLHLSYGVDGAPEQTVGDLTGTPSPYPVGSPKLFKTSVLT